MPAPAQTSTLNARHRRAGKRITAVLAAAVILGSPLVSAGAAQAADDPWPPHTEVTVFSGTLGENDWYTTATTVELGAVDNVGVVQTQYRFGSDEWITYAGAVTLPEGAHDLSFRSSDAAGNVEVERVFGFKVDTVAPTVSARVDPESRIIFFDAADASSGIDGIQTSEDDGATWDWIYDTIAVGGDGTSLVYRVTDVAGHVTYAPETVVVAPEAIEHDDGVWDGGGEDNGPDPIAPLPPEPNYSGDYEFVPVPVGSPEFEKPVGPLPNPEPVVEPVIEEPEVKPVVVEPVVEEPKPIAEVPALILTAEEPPATPDLPQPQAAAGALTAGASGIFASVLALAGGLVMTVCRLRKG